MITITYVIINSDVQNSNRFVNWNDMKEYILFQLEDLSVNMIQYKNFILSLKDHFHLHCNLSIKKTKIIWRNMPED